MEYSILPMLPDHWLAVREIYGQGIATGNATFETELPDWEKWDHNHRKDCRLVAVETSRSQVVGWAALSPVSSRHVYRGVAEVSVYVGSSARGRGIAKALLRALVRESEAAGIWTLQAGIFPENAASITVHKSCGFHEVGVRQKIGSLNGIWRDVLLLERRSSIVS
jgi:L-amino acid N-acyltransferase YncA